MSDRNAVRRVPGEARYVVTFPLVVARTPRGDVYRYQRALLPPDTDPVQVASLLRDGAIAPIDPEDAVDLRSNDDPNHQGRS